MLSHLKLIDATICNTQLEHAQTGPETITGPLSPYSLATKTYSNVTPQFCPLPLAKQMWSISTGKAKMYKQINFLLIQRLADRLPN